MYFCKKHIASQLLKGDGMRSGGGRMFFPHGTIKDKICDPNGRFLILKCAINNEEYLFANIYGPNNDDPVLFWDIIRLMGNFQTDLKIIAGDFNLYLDSVDKLGGNPNFHTNSVEIFKAYFKESNMIDV